MPTRPIVGLFALLTACGAPPQARPEAEDDSSEPTVESAARHDTDEPDLVATTAVQPVDELRVFNLPAPPGSTAPAVHGDASGLAMAWLETAGTPSIRVATHDGEEWQSDLEPVAEGEMLASSVLAVARARSGGPWVAWTAVDAERTVARTTLARGGRWTRTGPLARDASGPTYLHPVATAHGDRAALLAWVDGRDRRAAPDAALALRAVTIDDAGKRGAELELLAAVDGACSIAAAKSGSGGVVAARTPDGQLYLVGPALSEPMRLTEHSAPCPGGAPALDARGRKLAIAWQDADGALRLRRGEDPRQLPPALLIPGTPRGRAMVSVGDTSTLVSWLEEDPEHPELRQLLVRAVDADGRLSPPRRVATLPSSGASAPLMARLGDRMVWIWTDPGDGALPRVRGVQAPLARVEDIEP